MAISHYPAIVEGDAKSGYSVFFPDLPGCTSGGRTLQEAALNAEEALAGHVALMLEGGEALPEPSVLDVLPRPIEPDVPEAARLLVRVGVREKMPTMSARPTAELYEDDFYAWTQRQAKELRRFARTRPNVPLDLEHIAEEIADLGISERNSVRSWSRRVIEHLLLLEHSQAKDSRQGWAEEILNFRAQIEDRLTATLRRDLQRRLPQLYARARRDVEKRLELYGEADRASDLPERCPYTLDQVLGDFWPASVTNGTGVR